MYIYKTREPDSFVFKKVLSTLKNGIRSQNDLEILHYISDLLYFIYLFLGYWCFHLDVQRFKSFSVLYVVVVSVATMAREHYKYLFSIHRITCSNFLLLKCYNCFKAGHKRV